MVLLALGGGRGGAGAENPATPSTNSSVGGAVVQELLVVQVVFPQFQLLVEH